MRRSSLVLVVCGVQLVVVVSVGVVERADGGESELASSLAIY